MNGKSLCGIIIGLIAFVWLCSSLTAGKWSNRVVFYYGDTCPHCHRVDDFVKANNLDARLTIERKEVYNNAVNQKELLGVAFRCGIKDREAVNLPFLWDGAKCRAGEKELMAYFGGMVLAK